MAEPAETAEAVLANCGEADECAALLGYVRGAYEADGLDYEDVFYPLRHHHDSLALRYLNAPSRRWYRWGKGDFVYEVKEPSLFELGTPRRVNPFPVYESLTERGFDVVRLEDTPFTEGE